MTQDEFMRDFCLRNNIVLQPDSKWYKDIRHLIVPVQVEGHPDQETEKSLFVSFRILSGPLFCALYINH